MADPEKSTDRRPNENQGAVSAAKEIEHFTKSPLFAYCAFGVAIISMFLRKKRA